MRGLFLLLLLSNLIYLIVLYINGAPATETDPYRGVKFVKQKLTLLSELPPKKRPALRDGVKPEPGLAPWPEDNSTSEEKPATTASAKTEAQCIRVGGIRSETQLHNLREKLVDLGAESFRKGGEGAGTSSNSKFWVMLPPYPNLNQATAAATTLKSKKINDFFVVRSGEYENAVSLGVFSTRENAERRLAQITALNGTDLKARIEEMGSPSATDYFWLSFKLGDEASPAKIRGMLHKQGISQIKGVKCE
jgi:hypothetical protein